MQHFNFKDVYWRKKWKLRAHFLLYEERVFVESSFLQLLHGKFSISIDVANEISCVATVAFDKSECKNFMCNRMSG